MFIGNKPDSLCFLPDINMLSVKEVLELLCISMLIFRHKDLCFSTIKEQNIPKVALIEINIFHTEKVQLYLLKETSCCSRTQ